MSETPSNVETVDLQRSYGSNWTKTNVTTLNEWLKIGAFNIKCMDLMSRRHRSILRNWTIVGLLLSTLCGSISLAQFTLKENQVATDILNGLFCTFTFTIAIFTGYLKVFQIQERLESFIRLKQEWIVFSTSIASEFQLPVELRRDAVYLIIKNKGMYLNLLKIDLEIPDMIKKYAIDKLPNLDVKELDLSTLPNIILDIGRQEMTDQNSANPRNKDRFSHTHLLHRKAIGPIRYVSYPSASTSSDDSPQNEIVEPVTAADFITTGNAYPAQNAEMLGRIIEPDMNLPKITSFKSGESINSITLDVRP